MEYRILAASRRKSLEADVAELLALGWRLQGGVAVALNPMEHAGDNIDPWYAQAMTRDTNGGAQPRRAP